MFLKVKRRQYLYFLCGEKNLTYSHQGLEETVIIFCSKIELQMNHDQMLEWWARLSERVGRVGRAGVSSSRKKETDTETAILDLGLHQTISDLVIIISKESDQNVALVNSTSIRFLHVMWKISKERALIVMLRFYPKDVTLTAKYVSNHYSLVYPNNNKNLGIV